jgi:superfamily I DNA and RNA helicase
MGAPDFHRDNCVTLSTVHKAKGNEAFMVYVLGVDALFRQPDNKRHRNMIFTAMTRAKGWVRVSGIGEPAKACEREIRAAKANFPYLVFTYPSEKELELILQDKEDASSTRAKLITMLQKGKLSEDQVETLRSLLEDVGAGDDEKGR